MLLPCCWEVGCLAGVSGRGLGRKKPPQVSQVLRGNSGRSNSSGEFFLKTNAPKKNAGIFRTRFSGRPSADRKGCGTGEHQSKHTWSRFELPEVASSGSAGGGGFSSAGSVNAGGVSPPPGCRQVRRPVLEESPPPSPSVWPPSVHNRTAADKISGTRLTYTPIGIYWSH